MRSFLVICIALFAMSLAACSGCGEPTMTLKSPIQFGTQSTGTPYTTVNVPMAAPQTYVQAAPRCAPAPQVQSNPCAPVGQATPRYVPVN
jgi:hypothetical protein